MEPLWWSKQYTCTSYILHVKRSSMFLKLHKTVCRSDIKETHPLLKCILSNQKDPSMARASCATYYRPEPKIMWRTQCPKNVSYYDCHKINLYNMLALKCYITICLHLINISAVYTQCLPPYTIDNRYAYYGETNYCRCYC